MNNIVRKIVDFAIADNPTDIKAHFQTAIAPKIVDLLDAKKMEISQSLFGEETVERSAMVDEANNVNQLRAKFNKHNDTEFDHMIKRHAGNSKPGDAHKEKRARQAKDTAYKLLVKKRGSESLAAEVEESINEDTPGRADWHHKNASQRARSEGVPHHVYKISLHNVKGDGKTLHTWTTLDTHHNNAQHSMMTIKKVATHHPDGSVHYHSGARKGLKESDETVYEDLEKSLASAKNNAATLKKPVHVFAHKNANGVHHSVTARDMATSSSKNHEIKKTHTVHPDGSVTVH